MDEPDERRENGEEQLAKQIQQLESMVTPAMDRNALTRFGALKTAHPEKAIRALVVMSKMVSQGKRIDDARLRDILIRLEPAQRQTKITR